MKKLMLATLALAAAFTLSAENYTPSAIPSGLTQSDVTPGEINYQGVLRNPKNGELYADGIYTLECRIYSQESGGTALWGASYSAYVKDGYFNLMLGATGAQLGNCTYGPTELWKALWYTTGKRELYLGVTPRQGADGAALVSPTEIKPRQKLLTAPFAFRAQKAQYADAAPGNFKVGGNLNVAGDVTVANGKKLTLKNITATDSEVKIGTSSSSPATTTIQGSKITVESGSALNVNSHGNATVTMDSGKTLNVLGGEVKVNNVNTTVDASSQMLLSSPTIKGMGDLRWSYNAYPNAVTESFVAPIVIKEVTVTIPANKRVSNGPSVETLVPEVGMTAYKYNWTVGGFMAEYVDMPISVVRVNNSTRTVEVNVTETDTKERHVYVQLVGFLKQWSTTY